MSTPVTILLITAAAAVVLGLLAVVLRRAAPPMRIAAEDTTDDTQLPAVRPSVPGRHHTGHVQAVPGDYMPPVRRRRIAEATDTQGWELPR